jgi:uncharacterized membrane protein
MKEINVFGIYIAPFAGFILWSLLVYFPLRRWLDRIEVQKWVWHRPLFDTAVFVIILSVIGLSFLIL